MNSRLICSFIGDDKHGLIELLAKAISDCNGSWSESSMVRLSGQFAGLVKVAIDESNIESLRLACEDLANQGLAIHIIPVHETANSAANNDEQSASQLQLNIIGNDRPGIVYEVSQALAAAKINVIKMKTHLSSAPMSGDSLFNSTMLLTNEYDHDLDALEKQLDKISERLSIEIDLESSDE